MERQAPLAGFCILVARALMQLVAFSLILTEPVHFFASSSSKTPIELLESIFYRLNLQEQVTSAQQVVH